MTILYSVITAVQEEEEVRVQGHWLHRLHQTQRLLSCSSELAGGKKGDGDSVFP